MTMGPGVESKPASLANTRAKHMQAIGEGRLKECLICKRRFIPQLRFITGFPYGYLCCSMTCMETHRQRLAK